MEEIVSQKVDMGWVQTTFWIVDLSYRTSFADAGGLNNVLSHNVFSILDTLTRSAYIHVQSRKLCKIAQYFACLWSQILLAL